MRKTVVFLGVIVVALGGLLAIAAFATTTVSQSVPAQATGQGLAISPNLIGSGSMTISWSGQSSSLRLAVYPCGGSACSTIQGVSPVANGAGASGSVSFSAEGGQYYEVVELAPTGATNAVPISVQVSGLTVLMLIGIIVAAVGAVVALVGYRMKAAPKRAAAEEVAPQKEMFSTKPFSGVQDQAANIDAQRPVYRPAPPDPDSGGPVFFEPSEGSSAPAAAPSQGSKRALVKCPSCGTMNEPWITNCRNCRRPMSTTG